MRREYKNNLKELGEITTFTSQGSYLQNKKERCAVQDESQKVAIRVQKDETGEGRSQWQFHDKIDDILGTRPATHPPVVLETLDYNQTKDSSDQTDIGEELEDNHSSLLDYSIANTSHNTDASVSEQSSSDDHDQKRAVKPKKHKRSKGELWKT